MVRTQQAGENYQVLSVQKSSSAYRRSPCPTCPWRKDAVGEFPAEAFRISASTAYDMAPNEFACHSSGVKRLAVCAGYILNGSAHNLGHRLAVIRDEGRADVHDGGHDLFASYREMAEANGVDSGDASLRRCRP